MVRGVVVSELPPTSPPSRRLLALAHVACQRLGDDLLALAEHVRERYLSPIGAALQAVTPPHLANVAVASRTPREVQWLVPNRAPDDVEASRGSSPSVGLPERPLTPSQQRLLDVLPDQGLPLAVACSAAGVGRGVADGVVARGAATRLSAPAPVLVPGVRRTVVETPASTAPAPAVAPPLSSEQQQALEALRTDLDAPGPVRRLLWGVTGSGKTEVYLRPAGRRPALR